MLENFNTLLQDLEDLDYSYEDYYLKEIKTELNLSEILVPNYHQNGLKGCFDDNVWILENEIDKTYYIINFTILEKVKSFNLKNEYIRRIKLFLSYLLLEEDLSNNTIHRTYSHLLKFLELSNFFNEEYIYSIQQLIMEEINSNEPSYSFSHTTFKYLNFLIEKLRIQDSNLILYRNSLNNVNKNINTKSKSRTLPSSKDIMFFHYYINKFFSDNKIDSELRLYYKPIHIWWKLTNVIPMRPSELCVKLERNCIFESDEKYFIRINRIKENNSNNFPVLKELHINEEIAKLILEYINKTEMFGNTATLFSYNATIGLRKILQQKGYHFSSNPPKINPDYFTRNIFDTLLKSFYHKVIKGIYGDTSYNSKIKPGDTRHFAFFSLLMQGISPIEISLLGGHSTLEAQINYQNCLEYYIGTELHDFLTEKRKSKKNKFYDKLNEIIISLPDKCPKSVNERKSLEIGYCLCDFTIDTCDNIDEFCCFCSKWWGEPTKLTYNKLKDKIEKEINNTQNNTFLKLTSLEELLSRKFIYKHPNMDQYVNIKSTINEIRYSCNKIIGLKMSLIAGSLDKFFLNNKINKGEI